MTTKFDTAEFAPKLWEIQRLLREAYEHYFTYESHCKSYEGAISLEFPNMFDLREGKPNEPVVTIHSYVFADGRVESFKSIDDALTAVRGWHEEEMSFVPAEDDAAW